jgi:hypothetical protein
LKHKITNIYKISLTILVIFIAAAPALMQNTDDESIGWPRSIEVEKGKVTIYQPQIDSLKNDILESRSALSITPKGKTEPIFGAAWYKARIETDRDNRMVNILDIKVPRVRFPDATPEQEKGLIALMEREMPKWDLSFSLDRLLTALDLAEKEQIAAENLKVEPPKILVKYEPGVLIFIDGEPIMENIENTSLERVVNTPFLVIYDKKSRAYYLNGGQVWMTSINIMGPWKHVKAVPQEVAQFTPEEAEETDLFKEDERLPNVIVATEPKELISIDGKPEYKPIEGTDLLFVSNTESDVLMDLASQQHFILLSGRWYASKSMNEPWAFVASDKLPASFVKIPEDSENAHLLPFIAGSDQAKEAVLDAQIPQTSAIKREKADLKVEYDGKPQFKRAEDTDVEYAVNTSSAVFKVSNAYYCCSEAVWYVSYKPEGPWEVCDKVPDEIYTIPPSCPHYNTKYVYVYDSTPNVVYVGYYPGYVGSYIYGPTIVYGTGWYYAPWYGRHYYPHHWTWGFHVRWNPWYGWSFGFSFGTGPFRFNIGFGGWGGWGGWWGPAYPRPYWHPGGYRAAYRAGYRDGYRRSQISHYQRRGRDVVRQVDRSNIYNRSSNIARNVERPQTRERQRPNIEQRQRNNVYTDRNGNVYRRQDNGSWQQRDKGKWSPTQQPSTRDRSQVRQKTPSRDRSRSLENQHRSRQRGSSRTQQFQRSKSSGGRVRRR